MAKLNATRFFVYSGQLCSSRQYGHHCRRAISGQLCTAGQYGHHCSRALQRTAMYRQTVWTSLQQSYQQTAMHSWTVWTSLQQSSLADSYVPLDSMDITAVELPADSYVLLTVQTSHHCSRALQRTAMHRWTVWTSQQQSSLADSFVLLDSGQYGHHCSRALQWTSMCRQTVWTSHQQRYRRTSMHRWTSPQQGYQRITMSRQTVWTSLQQSFSGQLCIAQTWYSSVLFRLTVMLRWTSLAGCHAPNRSHFFPPLPGGGAVSNGALVSYFAI